MPTVDEAVRALSDEELRTAFHEISEWHKTGILCDGVVRTTHERVPSMYNERPLFVIEAAFLFEMARRHYAM